MAKFFWLASAFVMKNRLAVLWGFLVAWLVGGYLYMLHTSPPGDEPTKVSWGDWTRGVEAACFCAPDAGSGDCGEFYSCQGALMRPTATSEDERALFVRERLRQQPEQQYLLRNVAQSLWNVVSHGYHHGWIWQKVIVEPEEAWLKSQADKPPKESAQSKYDTLQNELYKNRPQKITPCQILKFVLEPHKYIQTDITGCNGAVELIFTRAEPRRMQKFALDIRVPRSTLVLEESGYRPYGRILLGTDDAIVVWGWDGEESKSFYVVGLKPGQQADLAFTAKSVLDR